MIHVLPSTILVALVAIDLPQIVYEGDQFLLLMEVVRKLVDLGGLDKKDRGVQ